MSEIYEAQAGTTLRFKLPYQTSVTVSGSGVLHYVADGANGRLAVSASATKVGPFRYDAQCVLAAAPGATATAVLTDETVRVDSATGALVLGDGALMALGEMAVPATLTGTGTAKSGVCEFGGFVVRAVSGTVNLTIYDATSATGTPIMTSGAVALGAYPWNAGRWRENTAGCHVVFSGGGTATIDVLAQ